MYQIGLDIGGTNIAVGAVDDDMNIVAQRSARFPTGEHYEKITVLMADMVRELTAELSIKPDELKSIGMAVPGSIDHIKKRVINAHNLQFHDVPLCESLGAHFPSTPVYIANDADAAALAELCAGAFVGVKTAVLLTLGTGVGGGLILGGRMFQGGLGGGIEPGHMILMHGGPMCTCGNKGCLESLCTATWIVQQGRRSIVDYPLSMISTKAGGNMDNVTAKLVIDCAKSGDKIALDIFSSYVDQLGSAVASFINILNPEVVALGGGVSNAGDFLFEPLRKNAHEKAFFDEIGKITPAKMGNLSGIIGAAMLGNPNTD